ncbi:TonB-dependent receptor domain-containing protein [Lysobacter humi (ex Lee et al. 2017)]
MTFKTTKLRDAITFALVVGATAAFGTGSALAQEQQAGEQDADTLDTLVVTGTRIQSQTVTSATPVAEIQKEEFQYSGATRPEDLLNQYPQLSPTFDSFQNNGATGYATVDLRNLGPQRTLTLVNGYRLPEGSVTGARDISIVPAAAIARTDLLTGGASAVYGSDAIAGVVNFILDDEFEGVSISAGYSAYQHKNDNEYIQGLLRAKGFNTPDGDSGFSGISRNIDLVVGSSFADGRGHAMGWATWRKNEALFQGERDYSACALATNGLSCGGSNTNAAGNFYAYQLDPADPSSISFGTSATINPDGTFSDAYGAPYNFAPINYYQRPDERYTFGTVLKYEINEHFRPFVEAMYVNKRSSIQIAESGAFFTALPALSCANPVLGDFCADLGADPTQPINIYVAKRNIEGGPRRTDTETNTFRIVAGVEGDLGEGWMYNTSFLYGQTSQDTQGFNDFLNDRIVSGILGCREPTFDASGNNDGLGGTGTFTGCLPYNVFVPGGVTPEAAAALSGISFNKTNTQITEFNAFVSGDTGVGFPWVEEDIQLVMGAGYREESYRSQSDLDSQEGNFAGAGGPALPLSGKISVAEVFLESAVPLLKDAGFIKDMGLELGYRLSDYDRSGRAHTWKVGLTSDFGMFRIRTGFNHAIRAPNIGELFAGDQIALFAGADPCAGATPTATAQQCLNTGVPLARYGLVPDNAAGQYNQFIGGNQNLTPEEGDTFTFGVVLTPIKNLQVAVDYFDITLENRIGTIGANTILAQCAATGDPFFCQRVRRNPLTFDIHRGQDLATSGYVDNHTVNLGELHFRGIDLSANYRWDMLGGRFSTFFNGTYMLETEFDLVPGNVAPYDCAGLITASCQQNEWRHIAGLRYARDSWTVNLRWRYFDELEYRNETTGAPLVADRLTCAVGTPVPSGAPCRGSGGVSAQNYIDLSGSIFLGETAEVTLGVNNIADKEPPMIGGALAPTNGNAPGGYDQAGRYFFGSVTFRF